jgi:two-component system LytT family response regulator
MRLVLEAGEPGRTQYLTRIAVQGRGRLRIVPVSDIDSIVANGVYVELCVGQERHLMRASLSTLAANLDPDQFFRVHRSALVKLDQIAAVVSEGGGAYRVQLQNGTLLPVARSRREELELRLGRI